MTLWSGRLGGGLDDEMAAFTSSLAFDRQLWHADLEGSRAHVSGLRAAGLVSDDEAHALVAAIDEVAGELEDDAFVFLASDEDIHTAVERRVTELIGPTGAKLHTGRSRNDQVATDLRLWTRRAIALLVDAVLDLATTLHESADRAGDAYLPGYTHLQRAQPVLLSHHLRAHSWALLRDAERLFDADVRVDSSPLGAGALAGSSLPLDPAVAARELGFSRTFHNSLDAVSDRDFVAELLFCTALCGVHLSRMGEELVLWTSAEFGFCELDDRFTTGSSMLPQKKNPDAAELARGKAGRLIGNLTGLLATLKGLPLAYNRDLQEDKEPLFDSVAQLRGALLALRGCYATASYKTAAMAIAADDDDAVAVDLAEWLVVRGTPFRESHHLVGGLVSEAHERGVRLRDVVALADGFGDEALSLFEPGSAVRRRTTPGGAGPVPGAHQRESLATALDVARARASALAGRTASA